MCNKSLETEAGADCLMTPSSLPPLSMDSFFLAEMFKYLFLLFADADDMPFDVEDYIFTTEAHLLPLSLSTAARSRSPSAANSTVLHPLDRPPASPPYLPSLSLSSQKKRETVSCTHYPPCVSSRVLRS